MKRDSKLSWGERMLSKINFCQWTWESRKKTRAKIPLCFQQVTHAILEGWKPGGNTCVIWASIRVSRCNSMEEWRMVTSAHILFDFPPFERPWKSFSISFRSIKALYSCLSRFSSGLSELEKFFLHKFSFHSWESSSLDNRFIMKTTEWGRTFYVPYPLNGLSPWQELP